jgi:tetratricopeptide (TPR) repeat protein
MKNIYLFPLIVFCLSISSGCSNKEDKTNQKSTDLITAKTLGLAYLEEFKLEEAEKQFLKFIDLAPKEKLGYANLGLVYLRMNRYADAEKQLLKGIKIDPKDPDIRLILATVYKMEDNPDAAILQLKKALQSAPDHVKVLYELTEIYSTRSDEESQKMREEYMVKLTEKAPGNIVPRLNLTDIYIRKGNFDAALEQLEIIQRQFPEFPKEAVDYYDKTVSLLKIKDLQNAIIQFTIFHN